MDYVASELAMQVAAVLEGIDTSRPLTSETPAFLSLLHWVENSPEDDVDVSAELTTVLVQSADCLGGFNGWVLRLLAIGVHWPDWDGDGFWEEAEDLACDIVTRSFRLTDLDLEWLPALDSLSLLGRDFLDLGLVSNPALSRDLVLSRCRHQIVDGRYPEPGNQFESPPVLALLLGHPSLRREDVVALLDNLDYDGTFGWWLGSALVGGDGSRWPDFQFAFQRVSSLVKYGETFWQPFLMKIAAVIAEGSRGNGSVATWFEEFSNAFGCDDPFSDEEWELAHCEVIVQSLQELFIVAPALYELAVRTQWVPAMCAAATCVSDSALLMQLASSPCASVRECVLQNPDATEEIRVMASLLS